MILSDGKNFQWILALLIFFLLSGSCKKSKNSNTWVFNGYEKKFYYISVSHTVYSGIDSFTVVTDSLADSIFNITNLSMTISSDSNALVVKNLIDETVCGFPYNGYSPDTLVLVPNNSNYSLRTECHTGIGIDVELNINSDNATLSYEWLVLHYAVNEIHLTGTRQ